MGTAFGKCSAPHKPFRNSSRACKEPGAIAWGWGWGKAGTGTSGSLGIWMSLLKYSMSEARRKKFLRLQEERGDGSSGKHQPSLQPCFSTAPWAGTCETAHGTDPCVLAGCLLGDLRDSISQEDFLSACCSEVCFPSLNLKILDQWKRRGVTVAWTAHPNWAGRRESMGSL